MTDAEAAPLSDEQALYMKHMVLQAIQDAHEAAIKPENFFKTIKQAVTLLAALETTVAMTTMMAMIARGLLVDDIYKGISMAASATSLDARRMYGELERDMRLVQIVRLRDPAKVN